VTFPGQPRIVVIYNRDFEGAEADPENRAREDVENVASHLVRVLGARGMNASALGVYDDVAAAIDEIKRRRPDAVFNLCESISGDSRLEPLIPMLLDKEGIEVMNCTPKSALKSFRKSNLEAVLGHAQVAA